MGFGALDVLGIKALVKADGSIDFFHDGRRSCFKATSPQGVGVFQQVIEETIPDDLQAETAADAGRFAERVDRSIDTLNKRMEELGRAVRFSKNREFDREIITVVNPDSGDIVRQIPPEYAIRVSEGLKSLRGLLFDDKA